MKPSLKTSLITTNLLAAALLSSCSGPSIQGLPKNLPVINLHGNKNTPPHTMAKNEYPFDEDGTYRSEWVAAGGGRSAAESDNTSWRTSHGGAPTPDKDYTPTKKRKFSTTNTQTFHTFDHRRLSLERNNHRHLRNIDCLSFAMWRLIVPVLIVNRPLFFFFFFCCGHLHNY